MIVRADKIAIMSMVNEGKISPEEGYRLYEALESQPDLEERQAAENNTNCSEDDLVKEIRKKMTGIYKDVEPHLQKTILSALETAVFMSDVVREKIRDELDTEEDS